MAHVLSPANCIRFTIFVSLVLISVVAFRSGSPLLFLLLYCVPPDLLITINYLQIRQGLALAIFLLTLSYYRGSVLKSAVVPALFHSSFLLLIPFAALRETSGYMRVAIVFVAACFFWLVFSGDLTVSTLLGRRAYYVTADVALSYKYWLMTGLLSIAILYFAIIARRSDPASSKILALSSVNSLAALLISVPLPVLGGRFIYNSVGMQAQALSHLRSRRWQWWAITALWVSVYAVSLLKSSDMDFFRSFVSLI